MKNHLVKTRIAEKDYDYLYAQARTARLTIDEVLGKAIAIGLYAMRIHNDNKKIYIHNGKAFKSVDLERIEDES